jgi:hypothetical protein
MSDQPRFQYSLRTLFIATTIAAVLLALATPLLKSLASSWLTATVVVMLLFLAFWFTLYLHGIAAIFRAQKTDESHDPQTRSEKSH